MAASGNVRLLLVLPSTARTAPIAGALAIVSGLPRDRYSVDVAGLSPAPADNLSSAFEREGARLTTLEMRGARRFAGGQALRELVLRAKPDVILSMGFRPDVLGGEVARRLDVPARVASVRSTLSEDYRFEYGGCGGRLAWLLHRRALRRNFHAVVPLSTRVASFLRREGLGNVSQTILNGIAASRSPVPLPESRRRAQRSLPDASLDGTAPVVTFAGRLIPLKGLDILVAAIARLETSGVYANWLIAGEGTERRVLVERVARLREPGRVTFLGHRSDMDAVLAATDIFCLPSRSEGLSRALLEAASHGIACVSSDVSGARDVIPTDDYGLVVPVGSPPALADALGRLLASPAERVSMGRRVHARVVERFGHAHVGGQYDQLFRHVLQTNTAANARGRSDSRRAG